MQENLYVNLIALAISHSDAQWRPLRKNRFECDMVWTQWNANAIPWTTASVMCTESVLCVKSIPPMQLARLSHLQRKRHGQQYCCFLPRPVASQRGSASGSSSFCVFYWSVFHFPSCEMLNHLQKMFPILTPELSNASDRPPWGGMCYHTMWGEHLLCPFSLCAL